MRPLRKVAAALIGIAICSVAGAQNLQKGSASWDYECINFIPMAMPYSMDFGVNSIEDQLMQVTMGGAGTVTYGGSNPRPVPPGGYAPCYVPAAGSVSNGPKAIPVSGKFCFSYGNIGSIQQYSPNFSSANLALNLGAGPGAGSPGWCYANFVVDGTKIYFGDKHGDFYVGVSNRYMIFTQTIGTNLDIKLQVELVADAVRFRWAVTNGDTATHTIALWFGSNVSMITDYNGQNRANTGVTGSDWSGGIIANAPTNTLRQGAPTDPFRDTEGKSAYIFMPNRLAPDTDALLDRNVDSANYPDYVDFVFGQSDPFGFRVENKPSDATSDIPANQPTRADQFTLGKSWLLLDVPEKAAPLFLEVTRKDTAFQPEVGFIQKYIPQQVLPGQTLQILNYVRSNWGSGNYALPYGAVVDAPHAIATGNKHFDGTASPSGLIQNPFPIRVWVDDVGGYAFDQQEFPLVDIDMHITFDNPEIFIVGGTNERIIDRVEPFMMDHADYQLVIGPDVAGTVNYKVTIDSQPGTVHKEILGSFVVAARPRIKLYRGANLISIPFTFADASYNAILANFIDPAIPGATALEYTWDATQRGYIPQLGATRGRAAWVIYNDPASATVVQPLSGNPQSPPLFVQGATGLQQLKSGWNMIGNPYNYPIGINQITGVSSASNQTAHSFSELVTLGFVSDFVAKWDPINQKYLYIDGRSGTLEPNTGYWINVLTEGDLTIQYPLVLFEGAPDSPFKVKPKKAGSWKLQLVAKAGGTTDAENYVGGVLTAAEANQERIFKPPMAPTQAVDLAVEENINGRTHQLATALATPAGKYTWHVGVYARQAGPVTISIPNLSSAPRNLHFRLVDMATGVSHNLGESAEYSYTAPSGGKRSLMLIGEADAVKPVITDFYAGPMQLQFPNRFVNVYYNVVSKANIVLSVVDTSGKLVALLHQGSPDSLGKHTIFWNVTDRTGKNVARGPYHALMRIITPDGQVNQLSAPIQIN